METNHQRLEALQLSYRDIAVELKQHFGLDRPPSIATVGRALAEARAVLAGEAPPADAVLAGPPSEADVVLDLCLAAIDAGIPRSRLRLEQHVPLHRKRLRADLALLDEFGAVRALVEVKRTSGLLNEEQWGKYSASTLAFRYCNGAEEIDDVVLWLLQIYRRESHCPGCRCDVS